MPLRTHRPSTRGMPRGLFGRNDLMAAHLKSASSYRMIRGSVLDNHVQTDAFNRQTRQSALPRLPLTGHARGMPKPTRLTRRRHTGASRATDRDHIDVRRWRWSIQRPGRPIRNHISAPSDFNARHMKTKSRITAHTEKTTAEIKPKNTRVTPGSSYFRPT